MATTAATRIVTLDIIRGVAVMGILTMNIAGFGLIEPAYLNPLAQPGAGTSDIAVYIFNFLFYCNIF